ncbi:DUF2935 domain-containing protein [Fictibacillus gelatini]|uniref:DUF2935 domain-containing protein n=1 Tax=Fictibacillus gelatini TaxID=225985 RepID=UPI0004242C8C|nr:DUF2935 domain-containing protein [Fictibacillus gelatini]
MAGTSFEQSALFEHRFWLQILGDHSRFILEGLSEYEKTEIARAKSLKEAFDRLLIEARGRPNIISLTQKAEKYTRELREYKLHLLERKLKGATSIHLSPSFFNHMVNELDEYVMILDYLLKQKTPPIFHELHYHLVWLSDAAFHAGAVNQNMDMVEYRLREKSEMFEKHFEHFYLKAVEMAGYLRTNLDTFPALKRMNNDVQLEMKLFKKFLEELEEMELSAEVLGNFTALMADHMAREECYYLMKLSESAGVDQPNCDPTKPRTE